MSTYNVIMTIIGVVGVSGTLYFGVKQCKTGKTVEKLKEQMERTEEAYGRIGHFQSQSRQICDSIRALTKKIGRDNTYDSGTIKAVLDPIFRSVASLNGQILKIYEKYSQEKGGAE